MLLYKYYLLQIHYFIKYQYYPTNINLKKLLVLLDDADSCQDMRNGKNSPKSNNGIPVFPL